MTNNPHQFDPVTRFCTGCGMAAQTLANLERHPRNKTVRR